MNWIRTAAIGFCAAGLAFAGANHAPTRAAGLNFDKKLDRSFQGPRDNQPPTPEEWTKIQAWMHANCPNRMAVFDRMSESNGLKDRVKKLMISHYRQIERSTDVPMRMAMLHEAQAQDLIFGAQVKWREAKRNHVKSSGARADLRSAVAKLIDAEMDEKGARIGRLQTEIDHLRKNRGALIDQWAGHMFKAAELPHGDSDSPTSDSENTSPGDGQTTLPTP